MLGKRLNSKRPWVPDSGESLAASKGLAARLCRQRQKFGLARELSGILVANSLSQDYVLWLLGTANLTNLVSRLDREETIIECFRGAAPRGAQFYFISAVLRALFSCSEMSLLSLETCTPVKAAP